MKQLIITTDKGESFYTWQDGGFLSFEQYVLATLQGILSAGRSVTNIEVVEF
jgi:hypothetical protein